MQNLLTVKDVAKILNVSAPLVYKMASNGQLRACSWCAESKPGVREKKIVRFRQEEIEKFISDNSH